MSSRTKNLSVIGIFILLISCIILFPARSIVFDWSHNRIRSQIQTETKLCNDEFEAKHKSMVSIHDDRYAVNECGRLDEYKVGPEYSIIIIGSIIGVIASIVLFVIAATTRSHPSNKQSVTAYNPPKTFQSNDRSKKYKLKD